MTDAWRFLNVDQCLQAEPYIRVVPGQTVRADPLRQHDDDLRASCQALDALAFAHGPIVCRVRLSGEVVSGLGRTLFGADQDTATEWTCLWMADATRILHEFALWCAWQALARERAAGRTPDRRQRRALAVKRRWINGVAADDELLAAGAAAWTAADGAAWAAEWTPMSQIDGLDDRTDHWAATLAVAWATDRSALWAAPLAAAWSAGIGSDAAARRVAQNDELTRRLETLAKR